MKFKILVLVVLTIVIVTLLFTLLKEEVKIPNVNEAFALLKENYSADISNNYSVINITNGWKFEFIKIEGNCSLECTKRYIYFEVYKNGSIARSEKSTNITIIGNDNDALNYVLYRFPEFKNISKCEFEEKLMCHEDVIVEKVDERWNVTFMKESKGCDNECVIRHYYSFLVEKDGKIVRFAEGEKMIKLDNIFGEGVNFPPLYDGWWRDPDTGRYLALIQWYEMKILSKKFKNFSGISGINIDVLPWPGTINIYYGDNHTWLVFIMPNKEKIYKAKNASNIYNILMEKFSTKTINNESDVLEAFGRYLRVFRDSKCANEELILNYKGCEELKLNEVRCEFLKLTSRRGGPVKVVKNGDNWLLNCSTACVKIDSADGLIINYKVRITNKGAVYIINKNETICKRCALVGRIR